MRVLKPFHGTQKPFNTYSTKIAEIEQRNINGNPQKHQSQGLIKALDTEQRNDHRILFVVFIE